MISHSHQFVFVHIPKTGGTSVANALGSYGIQQQGKINFGSIYFKHASAYNLERMMGEEYEKYLRFTIVRNPWDWAVSNFHYNGGLHRPFIEGSTVAQSSTQPDWVKAMGFKKWLKWWLETLKPSQKKMITNADGELIVDEVLKFEYLQTHFNKLCKQISISIPNALPHLESSVRSENYRGYYDTDTRDLIQSCFEWEIESFDYTFD